MIDQVAQEYIDTHQDSFQIFTTQDTNNVEAFTEYQFDLCMDLLDIAGKECELTLPEETKFKQLVRILDYGHKLWLRIVDYIRENYKIELSQLTFIYFLLYLNFECIPEDQRNPSFGYAIRDVFYRIYFDMKDAHKDAVNIKELSDVVANTRRDILKDFMDTFREIERYHPTEAQYDDSHKLELHHHLAEIYQKMFYHN